MQIFSRKIRDSDPQKHVNSSFQYHNDNQIQNYLFKFAFVINSGGVKSCWKTYYFSSKEVCKYFKLYLNLNFLVILLNCVNKVLCNQIYNYLYFVLVGKINLNWRVYSYDWDFLNGWED